MQDLIRKLSGIVSTRVGDIGENPAPHKSPCRDASPNRKLLKHDYILSVGTLGPWVGLGIRR
jgi:hypothetical protein